MAQTIQELWAAINNRLQSAQQRIDGAEDEKKSRYFKGQADALRVVLRDIEAAKFELGLELDEDAGGLSLAQELPGIPGSGRRGTSRRTRRPRKPRKTRSRSIPPESPYKPLADQAVAKGVIVRTSSHFLHDLLPKGHVQGFNQLYEAFEEDENLRNGIQAELDKLEAEKAENPENNASS